MTLGRSLKAGVLAGACSGLAAAAMMWTAVEPSLREAISLEESRAEDAHNHGDMISNHAEVVSRFDQQIGGTITVIVVACLLGLMFSVIYTWMQLRLPGLTHVGRSVSLAALCFVVHGLLPALMAPANPPGVGNPDTVSSRTFAYLVTILLGVLLVAAVFAINRQLPSGFPIELRWLIAVAAAVVGLVLIILFGPSVPDSIPESVPADLIWRFRVGSLAQLASMWLVLGLGFGVLTERRTCSRAAPGPTKVAV